MFRQEVLDHYSLSEHGQSSLDHFGNSQEINEIQIT